jgi:hypothetical protein
MRTQRFLFGAVVAAAMAAPVWGQGYGAEAMPSVPSPGVPVSSLPPQLSAVPAVPTAGDVLTTPATGLATTGHPTGTVLSPYANGCCGPTGGNGPVTYELYMNTGPTLVVGGSELSGRLNTGWRIGGGTRTLFFNTVGDAAWVLDLGLSYNYNRGRQERGGPIDVHTPPPDRTAAPDGLNPFLVRGLHRTTFNFAVGRDWWTNGGPAGPDRDGVWYTRFGGDLGGRWGYSHVDLVSTQATTQSYMRKSSTIHGVFLGTHVSWEKSFGGWTFFTGIRGEFDYTFTNVVPPKGGDIVGINLLGHIGVRY